MSFDPEFICDTLYISSVSSLLNICRMRINKYRKRNLTNIGHYVN